MRDQDRIKRYTLVPRSPSNGTPDGVRRFSLARVGTTPRSALGGDRLERMERIVEAEQEAKENAEGRRNGDEPT